MPVTPMMGDFRHPSDGMTPMMVMRARGHPERRCCVVAMVMVNARLRRGRGEGDQPTGGDQGDGAFDDD